MYPAVTMGNLLGLVSKSIEKKSLYGEIKVDNTKNARCSLIPCPHGPLSWDTCVHRQGCVVVQRHGFKSEICRTSVTGGMWVHQEWEFISSYFSRRSSK